MISNCLSLQVDTSTRMDGNDGLDKDALRKSG